MLLSFLFVAFALNKLDQLSCLDVIKSDEYNLYDRLFELQNYSPSIRPVNAWNETLNIETFISLIKIADVNEDLQDIVLHVRLQMSWSDTYLSWNSSVSDIKSIILPAENVWLPDMHLLNGASGDDHLVPKSVELYANGTIITSPLTHLNGHCDFDFARFPFDSQSCSFVIGTMTDISKVKLKIKSNVNSARLFPNPEWKLISSDTSEDLFTYSNTTTWSSVKFTIEIKRNSLFYVNMFVWPLVFILFVIMCIFVLPPICVERVVMGVMIILSLIIMLLCLESYTPKNSFNSWPIIGKLILFDMFMASVSTLIATLIIGMNSNILVKSVPLWLKNITVNWLAKIAFKNETVLAHFVSNQHQAQREDEIELIDVNRMNSTTTGDVAQTPNDTNDDVQSLVIIINNQLAMLRKRLKEKDMQQQYRKDWFLIASILDRICLMVYIVCMCFGLIVVFA